MKKTFLPITAALMLSGCGPHYSASAYPSQSSQMFAAGQTLMALDQPQPVYAYPPPSHPMRTCQMVGRQVICW